jgi:hypothetical protein
MRRLVGVALGVAALGSPALSDEIYRWTDASGRVHYANTGTGGPRAERQDLGAPSGDAEAGGDAEANDDPVPDPVATAAEEATAYSTQASLRRAALEQDLRATEKQMGALDQRLAELALARGQNARGSAATGGVAGNMAVRSEEETALGAEREKLAKHAEQLRGEYGKLRDEVTTRLGTTPAWWIDVR